MTDMTPGRRLVILGCVKAALATPLDSTSQAITRTVDAGKDAGPPVTAAEAAEVLGELLRAAVQDCQELPGLVVGPGAEVGEQAGGEPAQHELHGASWPSWVARPL